MGRIYGMPFENISISAAQDLFDIAPASGKPVLIHGFTLSNVGGTADAGDAQEELLRLRVIRGLATVGSGGSSGTAVPHNPSDTAAGFTARVNDTTVAVVGGGSTDVLMADGWNIRIPYQMIFTPELRPYCSSTQTRIVIRLEGAPNDAVSCSGTIWVEEFG